MATEVRRSWKIWVETYNSWLFEEEHILFAISFFKHSKLHKWKGCTFKISFFKWVLVVNYVNDYYAYTHKFRVSRSVTPRKISKFKKWILS